MKKIRFLSFVIVIAMLICSIPFTVNAAEVIELNGERTVFLGTFGKVSYNGKSYASFKTFDEALKAIGSEGGRIVLAGNITVTEFNDIKGRKPITIVGVGQNATGNLITFAEQQEINLGGDLSLGNVNIRTAPGAYIFTNGNRVTVTHFEVGKDNASSDHYPVVAKIKFLK